MSHRFRARSQTAGRRKARGRKNSMTMPFQRLNTHYGIHLCPITIVRYWVGGSLQYLVHWKKKKFFCWKNCTSFTHGKAHSSASSIFDVTHTCCTRKPLKRTLIGSGEQWTIAAAKITRRYGSPLVRRFILFYFPITIVINQNCYGASGATNTYSIYFTPQFSFIAVFGLVFLITHRGALDIAKAEPG